MSNGPRGTHARSEDCYRRTRRGTHARSYDGSVAPYVFRATRTYRCNTEPILPNLASRGACSVKALAAAAP